jgi:hypothetical protein
VLPRHSGRGPDGILAPVDPFSTTLQSEEEQRDQKDGDRKAALQYRRGVKFLRLPTWLFRERGSRRAAVGA